MGGGEEQRGGWVSFSEGVLNLPLLSCGVKGLALLVHCLVFLFVYSYAWGAKGDGGGGGRKLSGVTVFGGGEEKKDCDCTEFCGVHVPPICSHPPPPPLSARLRKRRLVCDWSTAVHRSKHHPRREGFFGIRSDLHPQRVSNLCVCVCVVCRKTFIHNICFDV